MTESERKRMKIQEITKEQLIAQIDILNRQITELKTLENGHKKVESDLRIFDEKFRFFFNNAPIGLTITNTQGGCLKCQ